MKIAIAADHAGFVLKEALRRELEANGHQVTDYGANSEESCDYPDFALPVARDVAAGRAEKGVLVCSTGIGMAIAANKVQGVRAAPIDNEEAATLTREHNDANVIAIGAKFTGSEQARRLVEIFLKTEFQGGRHARRVGKVAEIEQAESVK